MSREDARLQGFKPKSNQSGADGMDPTMVDPGDVNPMGVGPMGVDPMGMEGEMMEMTPQINARGQRAIVVRGVFPLRKQAQKIMDAKHDPTLKDARSLVDIANFEIQRQKAMPGPDPWNEEKNPWQTLDQSVGLKVLSEVMNYAEEIVDYSNTFWTITSPLPGRLVGDWSSYIVGHPKIKT
jgi:hypothetical protein